MSARQPFFSQRASDSQGTVHQKHFSIDPSNPLHLSSPAANQSESMKTAFSVPGPFSNTGAASTPHVRTSEPGSVKKQSSHTLLQSVERDRKGSLNSLGFSSLGNVRPGTAAPGSEAHQERATALEAQLSFGYQKASHHSLGLLDPGTIVRPGTTVPHSKALQDYAVGLNIKAPIPKPTTLSAPAFLSHNTFSDRIHENDAHTLTTETKGVSREIDDIGDMMFYPLTKGSAFNENGPQRVPIEQFGRQDTSDVEPNATMASHEITSDGRLKRSTFGQRKKRNRDEIEEDGDKSHWAENPKRHKSRHQELETRGYTNTPPFSPLTVNTGSLHAENDVPQHFPDARGSPRYRERRTTSPVNERDMPLGRSPQAEQAVDERRNTFEKLLGRNTDAFVLKNMEKYDALVKKWSECSEEEWIAGVEVIVAKYEKMATYVKNAMIAKIDAYANIQVDIGRHLSELGERDKLLNAAREKLIMESGNALG